LAETTLELDFRKPCSKSKKHARANRLWREGADETIRRWIQCRTDVSIGPRQPAAYRHHLEAMAPHEAVMEVGVAIRTLVTAHCRRKWVLGIMSEDNFWRAGFGNMF
jgi:hypothetical protein